MPMNLNEALAFAKSSAVMAFDQRDAYEDPIASYRQLSPERARHAGRTAGVDA